MIVNGTALFNSAPIRNMLTTKERAHGVSHGLSEAGYDIRIKQDILFVPAITDYLHCTIKINEGNPDQPRIWKEGRFCIASAIEEFQMPDDLVGVVHDKSTWARRGLSVFNTVIEPGWKGWLTIELVYHGIELLHIPAGAGIAQVLFSRIETPANYTGKYNNQPDHPVEAISEKG